MTFIQEPNPPRRQPAIQAPAIVVGVIAVLVITHIVRISLPGDWADRIFAEYALTPARYSAQFLAMHGYSSGTLAQRLIPFISYAFIHADFTHLILNCLWLLAFGPIVARRFGGMLFLLLFFVCAVAGGLAHVAFYWGSLSPVIGASGAISGLMAAAIRMLPARAIYNESFRSPLAPLLSRQVILFSLVWFAINAIAGMTGLGTGPGVHLIAWQAHVGGYLAGLVLAGPFDFLHRRMAGRPRLELG